MTAALLLLAQLARAQQPAPAPAPGPVQGIPDGNKIEFKTDDGWTLVGDYWPGRTTKPTFILVHMMGGRRADWEPLRRGLFAHGYGVLTYDSRGHGDSLVSPAGSTETWRSFKPDGQDNDFNRMGMDLDAAAKYLSDHGIGMSSIAVAGASLGANVALKWAAIHPEVRLAILLSPGINYKDVLSIGAMRAYGPRPVLVVAADDDRHILLESKVIFDNARFHSGEAYASFMTAPHEHGTRMLEGPVVDRILYWIASPIRPVPVSTAPAHVDVSAPAPVQVSTPTFPPTTP